MNEFALGPQMTKYTPGLDTAYIIVGLIFFPFTTVFMRPKFDVKQSTGGRKKTSLSSYQYSIFFWLSKYNPVFSKRGLKLNIVYYTKDSKIILAEAVVLCFELSVKFHKIVFYLQEFVVKRKSHIEFWIRRCHVAAKRIHGVAFKFTQKSWCLPSVTK